MLTLTRTLSRPDGIFGTLNDEAGTQWAVTLEHAYQQGELWLPKVPLGVYTCQRGMHRLHGMETDFETFEITNVLGHTNILFHWGNWEKDSEGCVLLGEAMADSAQGEMVMHSKATWQHFMERLAGIDSFPLTVGTVALPPVMEPGYL